MSSNLLFKMGQGNKREEEERPRTKTITKKRVMTEKYEHVKDSKIYWWFFNNRIFSVSGLVRRLPKKPTTNKRSTFTLKPERSLLTSLVFFGTQDLSLEVFVKRSFVYKRYYFIICRFASSMVHTNKQWYLHLRQSNLLFQGKKTLHGKPGTVTPTITYYVLNLIVVGNRTESKQNTTRCSTFIYTLCIFIVPSWIKINDILNIIINGVRKINWLLSVYEEKYNKLKIFK